MRNTGLWCNFKVVLYQMFNQSNCICIEYSQITISIIGLMLLSQRIVGQHFLLSFYKEWPNFSCVKGDKLEGIEAPFIIISIIRTALIMLAARAAASHVGCPRRKLFNKLDKRQQRLNNKTSILSSCRKLYANFCRDPGGTAQLHLCVVICGCNSLLVVVFCDLKL